MLYLDYREREHHPLLPGRKRRRQSPEEDAGREAEPPH
jgi:hypothetical protein